MKKLLGIVVLGLLLVNSSYSEEANSHGGANELPESARPNDATISLFEERKKNFIEQRRREGRLYTVSPKGNAKNFNFEENLVSSKLEKQLSKGFLLSYLFYDNGIIKYDGKAKDGRFKKDITNETLFYTHSTGKSITSYIVGHAICDGYISSIDEIYSKNIPYVLKQKIIFISKLDKREQEKILGLSLYKVKLAMDRKYSIPILFKGSEVEKNEFIKIINVAGLTAQTGGRIINICDKVNKSTAIVKTLKLISKRIKNEIITRDDPSDEDDDDRAENSTGSGVGGDLDTSSAVAVLDEDGVGPHPGHKRPRSISPLSSRSAGSINILDGRIDLVGVGDHATEPSRLSSASITT